MSGQEAGILALWDNATSTNDKLHLVYMQKWAALFCMDHMEAWSEIRRTDCPNITTVSQLDIFKGNSSYVPGDFNRAMDQRLVWTGKTYDIPIECTYV